MPAARPMADQLVALHSKGMACRSPYVVFALFGPYGDRITRSLKFQGEVLDRSELVEKQLKGRRTSTLGASVGRSSRLRASCSTSPARRPSTGTQWASCACMQRTATERSSIMTDGESVSSEQWDIRAGKFHSEPPAGYDPAALWNSIVHGSLYSLTNGMAELWYFEVVSPPLFCQ